MLRLRCHRRLGGRASTLGDLVPPPRRRSDRRFRVVIAVMVAAFLTFAAGVAYAMIPDGQGVIHGCSKNDNGQLRVIDSGGCAPSEKPLSWSQTGPQGPPGPKGDTGDTGPQGPPGVLGFYTKQDTMDVPAQAESFDGIDCEIGDNATGGGYEPVELDVQVVDDAPTNGLVDGQLVPHGWHFAVLNSSDSSKEVQISVVCADLP